LTNRRGFAIPRNGRRQNSGCARQADLAEEKIKTLRRRRRVRDELCKAEQDSANFAMAADRNFRHRPFYIVNTMVKADAQTAVGRPDVLGWKAIR
jgi:hypothetical protein